MRKDIITAIIVFVVIIAAGMGLMYTSAQTSAKPAGTPTPSQLPSAASSATNKGKLQVTDEKIGTGPSAKQGDTVTVNYVGTLNNGTQFDSSYARHQPFTFTLGAGQVIKGWDLGVVGMKVGGKRKLIIPPDLGYGNAAQGSIPPNSTLIFEIQLLSIKP